MKNSPLQHPLKSQGRLGFALDARRNQRHRLIDKLRQLPAQGFNVTAAGLHNDFRCAVIQQSQ